MPLSSVAKLRYHDRAAADLPVGAAFFSRYPAVDVVEFRGVCTVALRRM